MNHVFSRMQNRIPFSRPGIIVLFLAGVLSACLFSTILFAQNETGGTIRGQVVDESGKRPLEFVNVVLQATSDSLPITGTVTDKNGRFELKDIRSGEFLCRFSIIGYKQRGTVSFIIDAQHRNLNLGRITLVETAVKLDEVLVTRQKSVLNNTIDRKVYNVDQDIVSRSGSASEVLQNVPSVEVDIDGNVSLRGSSSVLILINGKNSPLMGKNRAEVLQQMPASSIDRIEVITNPSARYKPDGSSGIINIVLKKNTALGMNGSLGVNAGNQSRFNGNLRLNYNPGDLNLFGTYGVRKDSRNRINSDTRQQIGSDSRPSFYRDDLLSYASPLSHMVTLGFDYQLDGQNSLGASGNYFHNGFTRTEISKKVLQNGDRVTTSMYDRNRLDDEFEKEYGGTFFFHHKFPTEDHKIRFELNASTAPEQEDNHFTDLYWFPPAAQQYDNTLIKQIETKYEVSLDYSDPLSEETNLEAGYAGEFNRSEYDFRGEYFDPVRQRFVEDFLKTNRFLYHEALHALYITYEHSFGRFGLLAGLRAEESFVKPSLVSRDSSFSNNYASIYPTLHLRYKFSEAAELQLNYSRRTRRPEGDDLNPFPEYRDPRNISAGNPKLLPEYIHSVELGCRIQNDLISVLPSIYYRYTYNRFTPITVPVNDTTLLTTRTNLAKDHAAGFELIVSASMGDVFTSHASANIFYNQIDATNLGYDQNKSIVTWSGALTASVNVMKGSTVQLNTNFSSARLTPQGEYSPSYVVNLGVRQELLDGKLTLILTVADLFRTLKRELTLNIPMLHQTVINTRDSRVVYFGVTYHFGTPPKKSNDDPLKYDDGI